MTGEVVSPPPPWAEINLYHFVVEVAIAAAGQILESEID